MSTLDNLRNEAKRWLKALRANDPEARARLNRAYPEAPDKPGLRAVQHALARERGAASWTALKEAVAQRPSTDVATFLEYACWDHHVHGRNENSMIERAAGRILARHPEIARDNIYTAVVCGEIQEVERILARRPKAARESGGARGWPPLLYLCYARVPAAAASDNALAIARALLERGADPNAYYMAGDSHYTALVGVAGEGEQDASRHPRAEELYRLLLERGAGPYDDQVLYNTHFHGDVLWWLELTYEQTLKSGRKADWDNPDWPMLDMGRYGCGARFLLWVALKKKDLRLAEWLLSHGANPNAAPARDARFSKRSLYEDARQEGFTEMVDLLARYGATPRELVLSGEEAFAAACFRLDREEARRHLDQHPDYLQSPTAMFAAAERDRADVAAFLLDLGMPIEIEDRQKQRPLHKAAGSDALRVAGLLIERGAEIDPRESNWSATPLGYATHSQKREMIDFLGRFSRDVWNLTFNGKVERLREVLNEEPGLAKVVNKNGATPLWWLPDDEARAVEIVELFLAYGADPAILAEDGMTAADYARKRGMDEASRMLGVHESAAPDLERYRRLAKDLVIAYKSGERTAMQRVQEHFGRAFTRDELRARLRQRLSELWGSDRDPSFFDVGAAQLLIARQAGYQDWLEFAKALAGTPPPGRPYAIDTKENRIRPRRTLGGKDWDTVIAALSESRIPGLNAEGQMTDALLERIAALDHITCLDLAGSRQLTDAGLRHLARLPRLEHLDLTGCRISDRGLEVLRELPELRWLQICHHGGISDAGIANLAQCHHLEHVDLMNTATGDGAIRALTGKPRLRYFKGGNLVTDAGVALVHEFPMFKTWQGGEVHMELMSPDARPNFLWLFLKAPFLNTGLRKLAGLDGLFGLSLHGGTERGPFDSDSAGVTPANLAPLMGLPNLGWLGCAGDLCDDEAMRHIGALPRLRMLMGQGAIAGDEGFTALSRSRTIEYIWGREWPNLTGRGFRALSTMPALRGLAVSCKYVDDLALSTLPSFPALRELMPMDVQDEGFRYVGRCEQLEALWCMYCRDTTDAATECIGGLSRLKTYYAGKTRITDRSLEILRRISSLESLTFWQCAGITDAGVALLAGLPKLREIHFEGGMPKVSLEGTEVFPAHVRVDYRA